MNTIIQILSLFVLIVFCAAPAVAESPFQGGMKYTAMRKTPEAPQAPTAQPVAAGTLQQQTFTRPNAAQTAPEETAADKVWKKYKALAAGQAQAPEQQNTLESIDNGKTKLPEVPQVGEIAKVKAQPAAASAPAPATGFSAVIQKYHQNKAQQGQMRVLRTERPAPPQVQKIKQPKSE